MSDAGRQAVTGIRADEATAAPPADRVRAARALIVNADDFGQSPGINRGVIAAHERGIVTSASLMVRWPDAAAAAAYARGRPDLSLGLHVDLVEWAFRDEWVPVYQVISTDDASAVAQEVARQLAAFIALVGRPPTHLDSHQHVHRSEPVRSILATCAGELGVPLRQHAAALRYAGDFYGQTGTGFPYHEAIEVDALVRVIEGLPPGVTELGCHPGLGMGADGLDTMYRFEREREVAVLCDPRVRAAIVAAGIRLCSFRDLEGTIG